MAEKSGEITARRPRPKARAATPAGIKRTTAAQATTTPTPSPNGASAPAEKPASRLSFFRRLGGSKEQTEAPAPATTTKGGKAPAASTASPQAPAKPTMGRFFFGMMLYMVLAFAAQFALAFVFSYVPGKGQQVLVTVPLLGPITQYLLAWMVVLIVILWGLYKLKILPRTLGQPRERVAAVKADSKAASKPAEAKAPREPVSGPDDAAYERVKARLRSERRRARKH